MAAAILRPRLGFSAMMSCMAISFLPFSPYCSIFSADLQGIAQNFPRALLTNEKRKGIMK
jgi:hypothetical protein